MIKPQEIISITPYCIVCKCNNGEIRKIDISLKLNTNDLLVQKILKTNVFFTAQIGELGQIYWNNIASIKDINGELVACEYDLSPEFFYYNSVLVND
jgi:hypothetical protein